MLTEKLGIPFERIRLLQGDSDELLAGGGTGGSKSIMHSGTAIVEAAAKVIEQGKQIASHVLEAAVSDIEFANGRFVIAGTDRSVGIMELADKRRRSQRGRGGPDVILHILLGEPAKPEVRDSALTGQLRLKGRQLG